VTAALHPQGHFEKIHDFWQFYIIDNWGEAKKKNQSKKLTKAIKIQQRILKGNHTLRNFFLSFFFLWYWGLNSGPSP
jgi:hypothetical protein